MVKLLIFSDIHTDYKALSKIVNTKADLYINLGDLSQVGHGLDMAGEKLASLKQKLWSLPGNHETVEQNNQFCLKNNFFDFHQQVKKIAEFNFAGFGLSPYTPFGTPGEVDDLKIAKGLQSFTHLDNLVLFTHVPPAKTNLAETTRSQDAGSQALRDFIIKNNPLYCFSGHVHENEGKKEKLNKTTCFLIGKKGLKHKL